MEPGTFGFWAQVERESFSSSAPSVNYYQDNTIFISYLSKFTGQVSKTILLVSN